MASIASNTSTASSKTPRVCMKCKKTITAHASRVTGRVLNTLKEKNPNTPVEKFIFCRPCAVALKIAHDKRTARIAAASSSGNKSLMPSQASEAGVLQANPLKRKRTNTNIISTLSQSVGSSQEPDPVINVPFVNEAETFSEISIVSSSTDSFQREIVPVIVEPEIEPSSEEAEPIDQPVIQELETEEIEPANEPSNRIVYSATDDNRPYIAPTPVQRARPREMDFPVYRHLNGG